MRLGEDDRKYMVRVIATVLCTYVPNPSMRDCGVVAESLLRKYSFLKESVSSMLNFSYHNLMFFYSSLEFMEAVHLC